MSRDNVHVYQIYYNEETRAKLDSDFIPLDNTANARPDWYEFWPMLNFLRTNRLEEGHWYGFLSPRFVRKSMFSAEQVYNLVESANARGDVVLLSHGWDVMAYFQNLFEQGDYFHPGLIAITEEFLRHEGINLDLTSLVTHSGSSVLSNYVVAKPAYWRIWLGLAERLFAYAEAPATAGRLAEYVKYGPVGAPLKTFVQERLSSLILSSGTLNVVSLDRSDRIAPWERLFETDTLTRRALQAMDLLKRRYVQRGDPTLLAAYRALRQDVRMKVPQARLMTS